MNSIAEKSFLKFEVQKIYSILHNYNLRKHHFCLMQAEYCSLRYLNSLVIGGQMIDVKKADLMEKKFNDKTFFFSKHIFHQHSELNNIKKKRKEMVWFKFSIANLNNVWLASCSWWQDEWVVFWSPSLWPTLCICNGACWNYSWSLCSKHILCQVNWAGERSKSVTSYSLT